MVIDPVRGQVDHFEPVSTRTLPMEFPKVATPRVGLKSRYVYTSAFSDRPGCQYFDALQRLDTATGEVQVCVCSVCMCLCVCVYERRQRRAHPCARSFGLPACNRRV